MYETANNMTAPNDGGMVLRTEGLVKRYGRRTVVNDVSINVRQGEIVGLLGPNGAGKSTTMAAFVTALIPDLTKYSSDIADATKRVSAVLKNPTVKEVMIQYALGSLGQATVGDGINVQEAGDAILRLQKQLAVTGEQLPWLIDAIQASE